MSLPSITWSLWGGESRALTVESGGTPLTLRLIDPHSAVVISPWGAGVLVVALCLGGAVVALWASEVRQVSYSCHTVVTVVSWERRTWNV